MRVFGAPVTTRGRSSGNARRDPGIVRTIATWDLPCVAERAIRQASFLRPAFAHGVGANKALDNQLDATVDESSDGPFQGQRKERCITSEPARKVVSIQSPATEMRTLEAGSHQNPMTTLGALMRSWEQEDLYRARIDRLLARIWPQT